MKFVLLMKMYYTKHAINFKLIGIHSVSFEISWIIFFAILFC